MSWSYLKNWNVCLDLDLEMCVSLFSFLHILTALKILCWYGFNIAWKVAKMALIFKSSRLNTYIPRYGQQCSQPFDLLYFCYCDICKLVLRLLSHFQKLVPNLVVMRIPKVGNTERRKKLVGLGLTQDDPFLCFLVHEVTSYLPMRQHTNHDWVQKAFVSTPLSAHCTFQAKNETARRYHDQFG